jgi:FkbM family methyltransferase
MGQLRRTLVTASERALPASLMRALRVYKFDRARRRHRDRIVEHTYAGVPHRVLIASDYAEKYDHDLPALQEILWLRERGLKPGARVFDLGASAGVIAIMLADAVGPQGQVIALEAHPDDAEMARANRDLNGLAQLECLHAAVARESGEVVFARNGSVDDGSRRWGALRVPAFSIDDLAARYGPPDVVFVDVEGYEHEALLGAPVTLAAGPDWFVEVHEELHRYGASHDDVVGLFRRAGYDLFAAADSPYVRLESGEVVAMHPVVPFDEAPPELVRRRFFLLATRPAA